MKFRPFENTNSICEDTQVNEFLIAASIDCSYDTWKVETASFKSSQVDKRSPEIGYVRGIES